MSDSAQLEPIDDGVASSLLSLCDGHLDAVFLRAARLGVDSAWYGHIPFAHWLVAAARPSLIVELGTHAGVSYSAFCEAVLQEEIAASCIAVDLWTGDAHAGAYGEEVLRDLQAFHDARYAGFSRLLRSSFDDALAAVSDGTIDLLHIDGLHSYDAARHDFEQWRPKLSDRAVVLFHDTRERDRGFGVWQLWEELRRRYPGFEFHHAHGLGVLAVGARPPAPVAALCALDDGGPAAGRLRDRFAFLGERWVWEAIAQLKSEESRALAREALRRAAEYDRAQRARERAEAETLRLRTARERAEHEMRLALVRASGFRSERDLLLNSTSWRLTRPVRALASLLSRDGRRQLMMPLRRAGWRRALRRFLRRYRPTSAPAQPAPQVAAAPEPAATPPPTSGRIVFVSGEPHTPGHVYRVVRQAAAAAAAGATPLVLGVAELDAHLGECATAELVVVWRAPLDARLQRLYDTTRRHRVRVVFDIDDLMVRPELARAEVIDGIRSQSFSEAETAELFRGIARAALAADLCTCTTEEIALHLRAYQQPALVVANSFDAAVWEASRLAARRRRAAEPDGLVRLGYAGGSRTHQHDFAVAATAVARVLRARPACRLVLFRTPDEQQPLLDLEEFDPLLGCLDQVEWRDMVPLAALPGELARFDINLAPLETGNPFCEAKSELKYFEAALAGVCTVASPTGPYRRAIRDGETGVLATGEAEWHAALLALVDDPARRARLARAAARDVLWQFGPQRRAEAVWSMLQQLRGGRGAGRAFALDAGRARQAPPPIVLPETETLHGVDRLRQAAVTVVIPLYNYAATIVEALESVRMQSLPELDLIVVDDASADQSVALVQDWMRQHGERFNRLILLRNQHNAGLGPTRNAGFDAAETPFVLLLDADNRLRPDCATACLATLQPQAGDAGAAFAYPMIQCFGDGNEVIGTSPFLAARLAGGNYIDAMALVARWAWAAVGGYRDQRLGWEDYELWCRMAEAGMWGVQVPEVLAEYRVHGGSMLHEVTERPLNRKQVAEEMAALHPWVRLPPPE